jgi:membrane associated rhomboid family serine protease
MMPLFDENPARRPPVVTWLLIAVCASMAVLPILSGTDEGQTGIDGVDVALERQVQTNLRWAAVPCEVRQGRPLTSAEINATFGDQGDPRSCLAHLDQADDTQPQAGRPVFEDKNVLAAVISSMFLHNGWFHLGLNMLFLWVFGDNVEDRLGRLGYLSHFLLSGVIATAVYIAAVPDGTLPILGASGAVAATMGSYLVWYPDAPIRTLVFLIVVDIRARWFLGGWFALQFFTWSGPGAGIAHVAGFLFGAIVGLVIRNYRAALRRSAGQLVRAWDPTGGAGHGPYPHLDEVWDEPHADRYQS